MHQRRLQLVPYRPVALGIAGIVMLALPFVVQAAGAKVESVNLGKSHGLQYRSTNGIEFAGEVTDDAGCPAGKVLTGGGASLKGPIDEGWLSDLAPRYDVAQPPRDDAYGATGNSMPNGSTLKVYAICAQPDRFTLVAKTGGLTQANHEFTVSVRCPSGTHVTGGGVYGEGDDRIIASNPLDGKDADHKPDDGWTGTEFAEQDFKHVTTVAICVKGMRLRYVHADKTSTATGVLGATARCPAKTAVSGGGAIVGGGTGVVLHSSQPADVGDSNSTPEDGWYAETYAFASGRTITTYAICKR
jgi:hypothetical protein